MTSIFVSYNHIRARVSLRIKTQFEFSEQSGTYMVSVLIFINEVNMWDQLWWKSWQQYECFLRGSNRALSCRAPYTRAVIVKYTNNFFQRAFKTSTNKYCISILPGNLLICSTPKFGIKYLNNKSRILS